MVKKIFVFITILGLFFVGIPHNNVKAETYDIDYTNLASPNLTGKEYLGNGVYKIFDFLTYNVLNGIYTANGTPNQRYDLIYLLEIKGQYNAFIQPINTLGFSGETFIAGFFEDASARDVRYDLGGFTSNINFEHSNVNEFRIIFGLTTHTFNNYTFKLQIEKGTTATDYKVPIEALKQHIQLEKDKAYIDGYDDGYDVGNDVGYNYGFEAGLNEAFNENNLMPIAEKKLKGTLGPSLEFFGFRVPIGKKVNQITLLNLYGYILKDLDWVGSGLSQGLRIEYQDGSYQYINFKSVYNDFNEIMEFQLDKDIVIDYIDIVLALDNAEVPDVVVDNMLDHMANNLGFYINNKILNNDVIDRFKEIIEQDLKNNLEAQYQQEYETLLEHYLYEEFQKGYIKGINETDATGFVGLLAAVFGGLGSLLGIEILPGIYIGAIIAVPLVFGIIFFILGKRKGD